TLREALIQVIPFRIHRVDERDLLRAGAALDLFLAGDGVDDTFVGFAEDEPIASVPAGETRRQALAMLENAPAQIRGDARVKRPMAAAGEDVDARRARQRRFTPSLRCGGRHRDPERSEGKAIHSEGNGGGMD